MLTNVRFVETPNGPVVIADVGALVLLDEIGARRLRQRLSRGLGNARVLLRCPLNNSIAFSGDPNLRRYAVDPVVDSLPVVGIDLEPQWSEAA